MKIYYTFGTDERYPHRGGWVEVEADTIKQAHAAFRRHYPDRTTGILNCADYYTEKQFADADMATGNFGAFCHKKITA